MIIYLITFSISIVFTFMAQKCFKNNKKSITGILMSMFAITMPTLLASFRDENVGTDVAVYMKKIFYLAANSDTFLNYSQMTTIEFLYKVLNYIVACFSSNLHVFMFVAEFLIVSIVYISIYYYREKIPMWLAFLVFLLMYFNRSLNIVRQSIAIPITFLAFKYIKEKNIVKYVITIIIATLFHSSAFVAGMSYFIYYMLKNEKHTKFKTYLIIIIACLAIANYGTILSYLIYNAKILPMKYAIHIPTGEISIPLTESILKLMLILPILHCKKDLIKYNDDNEFLIFMLVIDFILLQAGMLAPFVQRISFYFGYYYIYVIPQLYVFLNKKGYSNINVIYIFILFIYWYVVFVRMNYGETYPYTSGILGIER